MKYTFLSLLFVSLSFSSYSQISQGGEPLGWESKDALSFETYDLPDVDLDQLTKEDAVNDKFKDQPYRFGKNITVDLDIHNSGVWTELENGDGIWRLAIQSEGASSLNFVFDSYILPEGAKVFVYPKDKSQLLGSFTSDNASKSNTLGVGLIISDNAIIEYHEPANVKGEGYLHINNVTHGYRDILVKVESEAKGVFGNSGACNINVNCPEGIPFEFQKRSVAIIVVNNNGACSGAMVNNVQQDGTPFFLTANHCLPNNPNNTQNWIFYFNHETAGCVGNNGPTNQSISGGSVLSSNVESDFALLELNSTPPDSYNVCYSGWDATDNTNTVTSTFGIHHPRGDVKKICFDEDAPYFQNLGTFVNQTWFIDQWELGVTEGGSSGSPLFNQNGLIIGQLAGGAAACNGDVNNGQFDYYGRMGVSWTFGNTPSNAIRFWLDPSNTGTLIVPNSCNSDLPDLNASLGVITGIPEASCEIESFSSSVNVVNLGIETIETVELEVSLNSNIEVVEWSGTIEPQGNAFVPLGAFTPIAGTNDFIVEIQTLNGEEDTDDLGNVASRTFEAFDQASEMTVNIILDDYPGETTWSFTNAFNEVVASGGPYSDGDNPVSETVCLVDGCFDFTIFDSANDGLCCDFGTGSYSVTDQSGTTVASGAEFDGSETTEICAVLDTQNTGTSVLTLFPNPATDILKIDAGNELIDRVSMYNVSGKLISEKKNINSTQTFFQTNALPSGLYVIEVTETNGTTSREKIVVTNEN